MEPSQNTTRHRSRRSVNVQQPELRSQNATWRGDRGHGNTIQNNLRHGSGSHGSAGYNMAGHSNTDYGNPSYANLHRSNANDPSTRYGHTGHYNTGYVDTSHGSTSYGVAGSSNGVDASTRSGNPNAHCANYNVGHGNMTQYEINGMSAAPYYTGYYQPYPGNSYPVWQQVYGQPQTYHRGRYLTPPYMSQTSTQAQTPEPIGIATKAKDDQVCDITNPKERERNRQQWLANRDKRFENHLKEGGDLPRNSSYDHVAYLSNMLPAPQNDFGKPRAQSTSSRMLVPPLSSAQNQIQAESASRRNTISHADAGPRPHLARSAREKVPVMPATSAKASFGANEDTHPPNRFEWKPDPASAVDSTGKKRGRTRRPRLNRAARRARNLASGLAQTESSALVVAAVATDQEVAASEAPVVQGKAGLCGGGDWGELCDCCSFWQR